MKAQKDIQHPVPTGCFCGLCVPHIDLAIYPPPKTEKRDKEPAAAPESETAGELVTA